jgi:hypothetical protein
MAFDYTELIDAVNPELEELGKPGGLIVDGVQTDHDYNPRYAEPVVHPVTVVQGKFTKEYNQGTLVELGDIKFLVSTDGVTVDPTLANRLRVEGVTYQIVRIDPVSPGPTVVLWVVQARK